MKEVEKDIKVHSIRVANIWMREDGILQEDFLDNAEVQVEDVKELMKVVNEYFPQKNLAYVDMSNIKFVSYEARKFLKTKEAALNAKAVAFKLQSKVSRIIGNFIIRVTNPEDYPTKLFNNEEEAIKWLKQFNNG